MRTATTPAKRHPSLKQGGELSITAGERGDYVKIYINGLLHVCIKQKHLLGWQSWVERKGWYCVEFVMRGNVMKVEYNTIEKWRAVVGLLEKVFS